MGLILLGLVALFNWLLFSPMSVSITGWLLIGAGLLRLSNLRHHYTFWHISSVSPDLISGLYLVFQPRTGPEGLTEAISIAFFFGGAMRFFAVFEANQRHKRWHALEAFVSCIIALLLYTSLPPNGLWFIGFALALGLIVRGWSWVMVSFASGIDAPIAAHKVENFDRADAAFTG